MAQFKGEFIDIWNNYIYTVTFSTGSGSTQTIKLEGENPVILKQDSDNLFDAIKTQSATIRMVTNTYLMDLYNSGYNVSVRIERELASDQSHTKTVIFRGYVTPNIYTQTYNYYDVIELECISQIAMLKYEDYSTTNKSIISAFNVLKKCLNNTQYSAFYLNTAFLYGYTNSYSSPASEVISNSILDEIFLDEINFFDDDEANTPWKRYEVIEEVMKIMGLSLVEDNNNLYMFNYNKKFNKLYYDSTEQKNYALRTQITYNKNTSAGSRPAPTTRRDYLITLDENSFFSSDNNLSLDETYRKIKIKANTFPYEDALNTIIDPDTWELSPLYQTDLDTMRNTMKVPSITWSFDDDVMYHAYLLYFVTSNFTSHLYSFNWSSQHASYVVANIDNQDTKLNYMTTLIQDANNQQDYRYGIGAALMKIAQYEVKENNVVNKLTWNPQIVLYTGVNNFNLNDEQRYGNIDIYHRSRSKRVQDDINDFMTTVYGPMEYNPSQDKYWTPKYSIINLQSLSDVQVTADSYMVISGKIAVNDLEWENSVEDEWNTSDAFKQPTSYKLIDQMTDFVDERNYIGFPMLQMHIRCGNPSTPQSNKILCAKGTTDNGQTVIEYMWLSPNKINNEEQYPQYMGYSPKIEVPVGIDKFGFYRFYDITNTCDWRLGLDEANGFAIPMPKSASLSGKLMVEIIGPVPELYYLYVPDMTRLPTTKLNQYEIERNPNNIWHNGWSTHLTPVTFSYEGTMPNCLLIRDLKFDIKEVCYFSYTDTVTKKSDNKETDHEYENVINNGSIIDMQDVECKINTQDQAKFRSFSSMMFKYSSTLRYIEKMSTTTDDNDNRIFRIQENNLVQDRVDHYSSPKIIFDCDLLGTDFHCYDIMNDGNIKDGVVMTVQSQEKDLKNGHTKIKLIEI